MDKAIFLFCINRNHDFDSLITAAFRIKNLEEIAMAMPLIARKPFINIAFDRAETKVQL